MSDYEDYENNLAFPPTTDRTDNTIEKLVKENERLKWWLREIVNNHRFTPISTAERALKEIEELEK